MEKLEFLLGTRSKPYAFDPDLWIETPGETAKYHMRTNYDLPDSRHLRRRRWISSNEISSETEEDPYCLKADHTLSVDLINSTFWVNPKTDSLHDLEALNLITTKKIVSAVQVIKRLEFGSWKEWYSTLNDSVSAGVLKHEITHFA